jgi:DNA repair exonuclease SbcCD ATPase subunit
MQKEQLLRRRKTLQSEMGELNALRLRRTSSEDAERIALADLDSVKKARLLLMEAGQKARQNVKKVLETLVTRVLQAVFDETYRFEVDLKETNKDPELAFLVTCGNPPITEEPADSMGGGVVDVVSLALRIATLELASPRLQGPLILDEPGRHLDKNRSAQLGQILRDLSEEFGRQIILVTHDETLAQTADRVYRVTHDGKQSEAILL